MSNITAALTLINEHQLVNHISLPDAVHLGHTLESLKEGLSSEYLVTFAATHGYDIVVAKPFKQSYQLIIIVDKNCIPLPMTDEHVVVLKDIMRVAVRTIAVKQ